ncbi:DedA family protein [Cryptosporangium aurantiacum]|uniref:Membrane protein DedA, SNARE-associated domain n=1 Tax=Cryptosporangium aurantiacum TaxID=134849 RepID=A0A1M7MYX7_9ACTN|nr:DedA family protein [Cryptosporangium aurantiacum]SHM96420.1 membrane protein DedA, SNARE-associated domain [Cryptosporangium aurantiacum]
MDSVVTLVTDLRAPVLYALILGVVFAETAVLLGMLLPGETAAIVAGVLAAQHQLSLEIVIPLVVVAAIVGDTTGYLLGRRFGPAVLGGRLLRRRRAQVERAAVSLRRHGWLVIVVSRFLPFLRTVTPAAAGATRVPYPAFAAADVVGCLLWGIGCPLLGYVAADSYRHVEEVVGNTGIVVLVLLILGAWALRVRRRRRGAAVPAAPDEEPAAPQPARATRRRRPAAEPTPVDTAGQATSIGLLRPRRRTDRRRP